MADLHIKAGGAWKAIDDVSVKVSGAWKQVDNVYVKVSGAWKSVWQNLSAQLPADSATMHSLNANNAHSGISLNSDGTAYWVGATAPGNVNLTSSNQGAWLVAGTAADFYGRHSGHTGTALAGGSAASGSWLQLNTTRSWYISDTSADDGAETASFQIDIATDASGTNIVATVTYTPRADYSTL